MEGQNGLFFLYLLAQEVAVKHLWGSDWGPVVVGVTALSVCWMSWLLEVNERKKCWVT